jgi:hypothetical protein
LFKKLNALLLAPTAWTDASDRSSERATPSLRDPTRWGHIRIRLTRATRQRRARPETLRHWRHPCLKTPYALLLLALAVATSAAAAPPSTLGYQGRLATSGGQPISRPWASLPDLRRRLGRQRAVDRNPAGRAGRRRQPRGRARQSHATAGLDLRQAALPRRAGRGRSGNGAASAADGRSVRAAAGSTLKNTIFVPAEGSPTDMAPRCSPPRRPPPATPAPRSSSTWARTTSAPRSSTFRLRPR